MNELTIEKSSKVEQIQRWRSTILLFSLFRAYLTLIFFWCVSLQAALEAASDYRKQVEGTHSEKQQQVLSMQHELDQVSSRNCREGSDTAQTENMFTRCYTFEEL